MNTTEVDAVVSSVLTWDYSSHDSRVAALGVKAQRGQWSATEDIDWSVEVPGGPVAGHGGDPAEAATRDLPFPLARLDEFAWELHVWFVSQFLHGEQGALLSAARLVEVLPDISAKTLAATQTVDEARHVQVFARYLDEKLQASHPVDPALAELLAQILGDGRWDLVCLGMQIIVEGLALAGLRLSTGSSAADPLIVDISERVARDEARHVSFGMLSLSGLYQEMTSAELRDREDFVLTAAQLMSRRFELVDVFARLDVAPADARRFVRTDPTVRAFRQLLFARTNASLARLGLITDRVRDGLVQLELYTPVARRRVPPVRPI